MKKIDEIIADSSLFDELLAKCSTLGDVQAVLDTIDQRFSQAKINIKDQVLVMVLADQQEAFRAHYQKAAIIQAMAKAGYDIRDVVIKVRPQS